MGAVSLCVAQATGGRGDGESTQEGWGEAGTRVDGTPALIKLPGSRLSVSRAGTLPLAQSWVRSQL